MNRRPSNSRAPPPPGLHVDEPPAATTTGRRPSYHSLFVAPPSRRSSANSKHKASHSVYNVARIRFSFLRLPFLRSWRFGLATLNIAVLLFLLLRAPRASPPPPTPPKLVRTSPPIINTVVKYENDPATESCELCILKPDDPLCEYGVDNVRLSRMYDGSGFRVRKFVEKAMRGEDVAIAVIGASVTAGHGIEGHTKWQERFLADWIKLFPKTKLFNGASPGMNSEFFSYCFDALVPTQADLYLVELDINNDAIDATFKSDDALYRGLLGLPHAPAVIRVSVFGLLFPDLARGVVSNLVMSQYHDIPVIGIRNFLLPHLIMHPNDTGTFYARSWGEIDTRHIGPLGHRAMGDMLSIYFREQTCEARRRKRWPPASHARHSLWPKEDILGVSPSQYIWTTFNPKEVADTLTPSCSLVGSTRRPLRPLSSLTSPSWVLTEWNGKVSIASYEVGATVSFAFRGGKVGIFVWSTDGKKNVQKPGRARCEVDGNRGAATVVDAWIPEEFAHSRWHLLFEHLKGGDHTLTCEILEESSSGGHDFRILGVGSM